MKTSIKKLNFALIVIICGVLALSGPSMLFAADFKTVGHSVTVSVLDTLTFTADTTDITLSFPTYVAGTESSTKTVIYTAESNNMRQADGQPAINVNLDALYTGLDLKAQVGTYTKTSGNASLIASSAGYVTIGTTNTGVAKKTASTGDGKQLKGTIPITYKAVATADLSTANQTHLLFVTLTTV
ncbi:MAG: hypothetical protein WC352_00290 [Candidatus Omnitrophota bacterium]|jgi:hypothetical protein